MQMFNLEKKWPKGVVSAGNLHKMGTTEPYKQREASLYTGIKRRPWCSQWKNVKVQNSVSVIGCILYKKKGRGISICLEIHKIKTWEETKNITDLLEVRTEWREDKDKDGRESFCFIPN